jgi:hypothetical protein
MKSAGIIRPLGYSRGLNSLTGTLETGREDSLPSSA